MMYAQRPNATLVGDYDSWKKVGRYVKRGSKGIAIFSIESFVSPYVFVGSVLSVSRIGILSGSP